MRVVLYTYDFEPITVLNLDGRIMEYIIKRGHVRWPVPEIEVYTDRPVDDIAPVGFRTVTIYGEPLYRRDVKSWILFTRDEADAMLLKSTFLPGQVKELIDEREAAFNKGALAAIRMLLR